MTTAVGTEGPETQSQLENFVELAGRDHSIARDSASTLVVRDDILSFRALYNSISQPLDVTGAFMPESRWFTYVHDAPASSIYVVDNRAQERDTDPSDRRRRVTAATRQPMLSAIEGWAGSPLKAVAIFCHGDAVWLQLGFQLSTLLSLAEAIASKAAPDVRVILFACLTGASPEEQGEFPYGANGARKRQRLRHLLTERPAGAGGMAFTLRNLLVATNPDASVIAHTTLGHATRNPWVRRFSGPADSAGEWVVPPAGRGEEGFELWQRWRNTLNDPFNAERPSTLLWRFPFMTSPQICAHLEDLYTVEED
jgi:hypothetical protein